MFKTIKEALEVYRNEFRKYATFKKELYAKYRTNTALRLPATQLKILTEWDTKLSAMETVLGLTERERMTVWFECLAPKTLKRIT